MWVLHRFQSRFLTLIFDVVKMYSLMTAQWCLVQIMVHIYVQIHIKFDEDLGQNFHIPLTSRIDMSLLLFHNTDLILPSEDSVPYQLKHGFSIQINGERFSSGFSCEKTMCEHTLRVYTITI